MSKDDSPWASGPGEILRHGLDLLKKDSDTNRRLAMISIDNAVELMIKTYLGLPKRITGIGISRKEFQDISESFPAMLDALEVNASAKLAGIDLGVIEWYHRLRNQLYHQGNGLTAERDKVEIYAQLAKLLYENLFGEALVASIPGATEYVGEFISAWHNLEAELAIWTKMAMPQHNFPPMQGIELLKASERFAPAEVAALQSLRKIRNQVVHGDKGFKGELGPQLIKDVLHFRDRIAAMNHAAKPAE